MDRLYMELNAKEDKGGKKEPNASPAADAKNPNPSGRR